jgi:hypothetical protein
MSVQKPGYGNEPPIEKNGRHDRFKSCGEKCGPVPAGRLQTFSQPEHRGQVEVSRCLG